MSNSQEGKSLATVLLVEDDSVLQRLYEAKFSFEGYELLSARDGETGLDLALNQQINILLLDIGLPDQSGLEVLEKLRKTETGKKLPVIMLTNFADQEDRKRALKLGAKEYLVKAMHTPESVVEMTRRYIGT